MAESYQIDNSRGGGLKKTIKTPVEEVALRALRAPLRLSPKGEREGCHMFRELMTEEIFLPLLSERAGVRPNSPSFTPHTHHFCEITSSSGKNRKKQNAWNQYGCEQSFFMFLPL
jgi:hypothetical protein